MALGRIDIHAVRNLVDVSLTDLGVANIFYGENGSGKTSVLESVHLLAMARSFRSPQIKPVINHSEDQCVVYGEINQGSSDGTITTIGISRHRKGGLEAKLAGEAVQSVARLAEQLPAQVINAHSFELLTGGPDERRRFLDWGVFHVEHLYHSSWRRFQRCLKQRNTLLRRGKLSPAELRSWSGEFVDAGEAVDRMRRAHLESLLPVFDRLLKQMSGDLDALEVRYRQGWDSTQGLAAALDASNKSDLEQGYTHVGPQRADLRFVYNGYDAGATLSRGQQKLVVCALKLAQGIVLAKQRGRQCVYLVDDLPSELDADHCQKVCEVLSGMGSQVFLTCVNREDVARHWPGHVNMFHVEHGEIQQMSESAK